MRKIFGLFVLALAAPAAFADVQIRTQNFLVHAPDRQTAEQFGQMAEVYRKQKAVEWIGREMEPWPQPCPLYVKPTMSGAGGATSFDYRNGGYVVLKMEIFGQYERLLNSVLPHEVTHTVFAHHFRYPVPRWADEGGAVLSEDEQERYKHDQLARQFLNSPGGKVPLRRLFALREYAEVDNVMKLYAEGFSVANFLVGQSDRQTFLNFVNVGMRQGWDQAARTYYGLNSVEQLEEAWLQHLRGNRDVVRNPAGRANGTTLAANTPPGRVPATSMSREFVRLTAPPAQPDLDPAGPVFRGQASDDARPARSATPPPGVIPLGSNPQPPSRSAPAPRTPPPPVTLGLPEAVAPPQAAPIQASGPSPVGFQN